MNAVQGLSYLRGGNKQDPLKVSDKGCNFQQAGVHCASTMCQAVSQL